MLFRGNPRQTVASSSQPRSQQHSHRNVHQVREDGAQRTTQDHCCVVGLARYFHVG